MVKVERFDECLRIEGGGIVTAVEFPSEAQALAAERIITRRGDYPCPMLATALRGCHGALLYQVID